MFRLGKTEAEAWLQWIARVDIDDDVPRTFAQAFDRYIAEVLPRKSTAIQRK